jgi:gamma-glutamyl-gamma-aminobutyrate hydrolase PuuD
MNIIDIGEKFSMGTASIFSPWNPTLVEADTLAELRATIPIADLVLFGGGEDIHPALYGHQNIASHCGEVPSNRDLFEIEVFKLCREFKRPMLGICRGAQFLCAMSGGELIQDVDGHGLQNGHPITTKEGVELFITSTHHQMMHPYKAQHELLAWSTGRVTYQQRDIARIKVKELTNIEPEVVYFPQTKALCVQGHPEYFRDVNCPPVKYVRNLVEQYLGVKP